MSELKYTEADFREKVNAMRQVYSMKEERLNRDVRKSAEKSAYERYVKEIIEDTAEYKKLRNKIDNQRMEINRLQHENKKLKEGI